MVTYIQPSELLQLLQGSRRSELLVVDVRDEDYQGGHIAGSVHVPSQEVLEEGGAAELARQLPAEAKLVVLHCQLSQIRGPKCANRLLQYMRSSAPDRGWPEVKVLSRGYEGFAEVYGDRPELFEGLR
ncbi:hypothetical protein WJX73_000077 [Symbiochloris irregularis]|uniref:Rhodanese domain-containing protein n=1 Tax=Symbiochloris irregularis TaxID=706552 RepID=A0AAW1Q031_9CHLO